MCILVVDDDDGLRKLLCAQLSDLGYTVDSAVDGVDALSRLMNRTYDIIVTDLDMPGLDGAALWRHACGSGHKGQWIMITGDRRDPRVPNDLLPILEKPFRLKSLLDVIEQMQRDAEHARDPSKA